MVDEKLTFQRFGYYSYNLTPKTTKKVVSVCDKCGRIKEVHKASYVPLCKICKQKGVKLTKEHCQKISDAKKGIVFSKKHCQRISKAKKGKKQSRETCLKKSKAMQKSGTMKKLLSKIQASPNGFEIKCLQYLEKISPGKFKYTGDGSRGDSSDAYSKELNTVALFQGDYWHCNPKKHKANYYHKQIKKTAKEIWAKDRKTIKLFEQAGYKVIKIWENDINSLLENTKKERPKIACNI